MAIHKEATNITSIKQAVKNKALANEWFQRDKAKLQAYVTRMLPSGLSAEDVVQEVFSRLVAHNDLSTLTHPTAYMKTIAKNCVVNYLRKHQKVTNIDDNESDLREEDTYTLQHSEMMIAIEEALNDLPQRCRMVFILSRYKGLDTHEIAEALSISPRMVQKHLVKAFDHFRERLL